MNADSDKILLVDDNPDVLDVTSRFLMLRGYNVVTASTGARVPDLAGATNPSLTVLDIMMPDVDGETLARVLRGRYPGMPIIFYSAIDYERGIEIRSNITGTVFVSKSDGVSALCEAVVRAMSRRQSH